VLSKAFHCNGLAKRFMAMELAFAEGSSFAERIEKRALCALFAFCQLFAGRRLVQLLANQLFSNHEKEQAKDNQRENQGHKQNLLDMLLRAGLHAF
jgi:hypothetical protein